MTTRRWLGILCGLLAAFAVFWFGYDLLLLLGGRNYERSALTTLLLALLVILVGIQAGAIVGWGQWLEDHTFPANRSLVAFLIITVLLVLSVVPIES